MGLTAVLNNPLVGGAFDEASAAFAGGVAPARGRRLPARVVRRRDRRRPGEGAAPHRVRPAGDRGPVRRSVPVPARARPGVRGVPRAQLRRAHRPVGRRVAGRRRVLRAGPGARARHGAAAGRAVRAPARPVFANTAGASYGPDPAANREVLAEQLRRPVEFVAGLRAMRDAGCTVLVEFGPRQVLSRLAERTLGDDGVIAIPCDLGPKADADLALKRAAVRLAVVGAPVGDINRFDAAPPRRHTPSGLVVTLNGRDYVPEARKAAYQAALDAPYRVSAHQAPAAAGPGDPAPAGTGAPAGPSVPAPAADPATAGGVASADPQEPVRAMASPGADVPGGAHPRTPADLDISVRRGSGPPACRPIRPVRPVRSPCPTGVSRRLRPLSPDRPRRPRHRAAPRIRPGGWRAESGRASSPRTDRRRPPRTRCSASASPGSPPKPGTAPAGAALEMSVPPPGSV